MLPARPPTAGAGVPEDLGLAGRVGAGSATCWEEGGGRWPAQEALSSGAPHWRQASSPPGPSVSSSGNWELGTPLSALLSFGPQECGKRGSVVCSDIGGGPRLGCGKHRPPESRDAPSPSVEGDQRSCPPSRAGMRTVPGPAEGHARTLLSLGSVSITERPASAQGQPRALRLGRTSSS